MSLNEVTVAKLDKESRARAQDMDLRHKACGGPIELDVTNNVNDRYWTLTCSRCHAKTMVNIGEDTKAIAITAIDGQVRTLSNGQTVEQVTAIDRDPFGLG